MFSQAHHPQKQHPFHIPNLLQTTLYIQYQPMNTFLFLALILTVVFSYNQTWAIIQAKLSAITHCSIPQIQQWNCKLCKEYPHLQNVSQIQSIATKISGFIGYDGQRNTIVIAWRGTVGAQNWIQDLDFKLIAYTGPYKCVNCKIHQGFYNAYQSVSKKVQDKMQQLIAAYPEASITITGHSLGGALSLVTCTAVCYLALFLYRLYPSKITQLYNFGCTRIGNANLASYLHLTIPKIFRVVHYKDLVPHYPPNDLQYLHPAFEIFYDQDFKTYKICNESGEDSSCSNQYFPNYNMNDHTFYWVKTDASVC